MFGYVLANRQALSEAELARYRGCYCGLCHAIGRAYGQPQRFALSYDLTFLVLLLSSLYEPPETQAQRRCLAHPLRRHGQWQSEFTGYAAAMNVALAYYQRLDDWTDDHAPLAWAESRMFQGSIPAIVAAYPRQLQAITDALDKLRTLELQDVQEPDQPAAAFGALMAALFSPRQDRWTPLLQQMGEALGRYIYLLDALADLPEDLRKNRYNPLRSRAEAGLTRETLLPVLQILMGECTDAFERLPLVQDVGLMRNILYSGVWARYHALNRSGKEADHV